MKSRTGLVALCLPLALALAACGAEPRPAPAPGTTDPRVLGFVFTKFRQAVAPRSESACPEGFNLNSTEWTEKLGIDVESACGDPTSVEPPPFYTLDSPGVIAGLDLDATTSTRSDAAVPVGACAHDDFDGTLGEAGIDNQVWRVVGCIRGFQEGDLIETTATAAIKDGSRTMLMEIAGVDDVVDDPEVSVRLFSSTDPAPKDASGGILAGASLFVHEDVRFHGPPARGSIVDGILTTEPFDVRLQLKIQTIDSEYVFRDAQLRIELLADGTARGILGAYWDVANFYDINGGHFLARPASHFLGFNCAALHAAAYRMADGHPDPETGACTSLSSAHEVEAVQAFVIHPEVVATQ